MHRPRWRIAGASFDLVLVPWGGEGATSRAPLDAAEALRRFDQLLAAEPPWSIASRVVVEAARHLRRRDARAASDPRATVREALSRGLVRAWLEEVRATASTLPAELDDDALSRIPLASTLVRTWIEIELTDMEGNPASGRRYWIKLPDGTVREGALDRHGRAYFGDLDPGECEVRWPDLDEEAAVVVRPAHGQPTVATRERSWIEVELLDMEDQPVRNERYWVKLPDGTVRTGVTDADGRALLPDVDPGECEVRWPDRDPGALEVVAAR